MYSAQVVTVPKIGTSLTYFYRKNGRASAIPHFTFTDFIDYLYSIENDILDPSINQVNLETADAPLSHYFINSSHNSYLTGRSF